MIDLRSDTVTKPTRAMRAAMADAEVGDDVYADDPSCRALEERVADLLGKQAAVFTTTGSMANMLGVHALVRPGQESLCEATAHVARAELGAHAAIFGVTFRTWSAERGRLDLDAIGRMLAPDAGPHLVSTSAVVVENTHNFGGGSIQPYDSMLELREMTAPVGVGIHLDGARLWNASVASGVPVGDYAAAADTVSVCLSKGLGAPVGSVLAGPADLIDEARIWRKRLGGGWRQAGVLAAAGMHALDHHVERLADDHERARELAVRLDAAVPGVVDPRSVETNIVILDVSRTGRSAAEIADRAKANGVLVGALGASTIRLLTHVDVSAEDCRLAGDVLIGALTSS